MSAGLKANADGSAAIQVGGSDAITITSGLGVLAVAPTGLGYGTGAGGTVTQLTSKSTTVTLHKPIGQIITAADALAAGAVVNFSVLNVLVQATDVIIVTNNKNSNYRVQIVTTAAGSFTVSLKNEFSGSLSEAVTINFAVIKGVTS